MLKSVIEAGKDIVDISFFPEDPFLLDELAKTHQVTAVVDCGVAPGMSNIILGNHSQKMDIERYECYVGGLPVIRKQPFEYKAPFSPADVIEEFVRPARFVVNGNTITKSALTDIETLEFDEVGTLEAFNTDGLRTLIHTMNIPNMIEKTMRYPGHAALMKLFREIGFFDETPVDIHGIPVRPIDLTSKLIFPKWQLKETEEDITVMRIIIAGIENGDQITYEYSLLDRYNCETNTSSMAKTTGFTCTSAARLILNKQFDRKGICPPEYLGMKEGCLSLVLDDLKKRGVNYIKYPPLINQKATAVAS